MAVAGGSTLLAVMVSETNSAKQYEIRRGRDGVAYCGCVSWKMSHGPNKTCKHLRAYLSNEAVGFQATQPSISKAILSTPSVVDEAEMVVNEIARQCPVRPSDRAVMIAIFRRHLETRPWKATVGLMAMEPELSIGVRTIMFSDE